MFGEVQWVFPHRQSSLPVRGEGPIAIEAAAAVLRVVVSRSQEAEMVGGLWCGEMALATITMKDHTSIETGT